VNCFPHLLLLSFLLSVLHAHAYDVLCRKGNTSFHAEFHTGVRVDVGPPIQGDLAAARVCRASLSWSAQEIVIADQAAEVDLDIFGVDLGDGVPVAAFQIKSSEAECCMTYKIYSLKDPPQLLRTLHGGTYFSGIDRDLTGQVEIWTDDAAAVDGLEGLRVAGLHFPPTCVLRFEEGKLLDVSSEFEPYFDQVIARIRAEMNSDQLQKFKLSNENVAVNGHSSPQEDTAIQPSLAIKEQVLELVWAYLYSNRDKQAWLTLAEMWPAGDVDRIRSAIIEARSRGIRAQIDGASDALPALQQEHAKIYDSVRNPARPIFVRYYPSGGPQLLRGKLKVTLVVDSAGKVWSVKISGKNEAAYESVKRSTANWKFIPAFVDASPVASRVRMTISLEQ
jgi:hypothetical protein